MNHPDLYHKANEVQRHDSENVIKEYSGKIQWRCDGRDSLIDLGSGSGDVLMDFVYPRMPQNFQRLVCSDINPKMVNYARNKYGHIKGAEFHVLDIGTQKDLPVDLNAQFDHVTSFYALMWVRNQRQGLKNIFNLLRTEGGDCLLMFLVSHPIYNGYMLTSQLSKWSKYLHDVDAILPPLQYSREPAKEYAHLMSEVGFHDYSVELHHKIFTYNSLEAFKANMKAVNPFLDRIPVSLRDDYMDDVICMFLKSLGLPTNKKEYNSSFPISYRLLVVYARKKWTNS